VCTHAHNAIISEAHGITGLITPAMKCSRKIKTQKTQTELTVMINVFWVMTARILVGGYIQFGGTSRISLLKTEAECSHEMGVSMYQTTT
jgi:hypothetical protein